MCVVLACKIQVEKSNGIHLHSIHSFKTIEKVARAVPPVWDYEIKSSKVQALIFLCLSIHFTN